MTRQKTRKRSQYDKIVDSDDGEHVASAPRSLVPVTNASASGHTDNWERIAVIGMGTRFARGSATPEAFWDMLTNGTDCISEVPASRWSLDDFYSITNDPGKMNSRFGGFISEPLDMFDASMFGISPREADRLDPQQRLLLEVSWEALERAGYCTQTSSGSPVGVYVGICSNDFQMLQACTGNMDLVDNYFGTGNATSCAAGRISYLMNFQGPNIAVDTACSSSLVSTHLAVQALREGDCDMALACGVNVLVSPVPSINFAQAGMLSPGGRCKTFDASADGYVRGEGCGVIVLKRLSVAQKAGDSIMATIRGSALNHDGRSSGLTAPNGLSQQRVIRSALDNARIQPEDIGYLETHGTGTSLGDLIELGALQKVLKRNAGGNLILGSIKTNLGHLEGAAGIAGLCKIILACQKGAIPNIFTCVPRTNCCWITRTWWCPKKPCPGTALDRVSPA